MQEPPIGDSRRRPPPLLSFLRNSLPRAQALVSPFRLVFADLTPLSCVRLSDQFVALVQSDTVVRSSKRLIHACARPSLKEYARPGRGGTRKTPLPVPHSRNHDLLRITDNSCAGLRARSSLPLTAVRDNELEMPRPALPLVLFTLFLLGAAHGAHACRKESYLQLPGVRLQYLDWGGRGEPVLLVPGGCDTASVFDDFAPLLTPRFHVLGVTARGCGGSGNATEGYDIDRQIDDLIAFLDALGISRASFAGHSSGGGKIIRLAKRYPARVRAIVTFDIVYRGVPDAFESLMDNAIKAKTGAVIPISLDSHRRSFQAWELGVWSPALECEFHQTTETQADGSLEYRARPAGWQSAFVDDMKAGRYYETAIQVPALFFVARDLDLHRIRQFPIEQRRQLRPLAQAVIRERRQQIDDFKHNGPHVKIKWVPHASHYLFIDRANEVAAQTMAFLQSPDGRQQPSSTKVHR